jgi:uncharacterized protein
MTTARPERRALALSRLDLQARDQLLVHACEDCACEVSAERTSATPEPRLGDTFDEGRRWVMASQVAEIRVDAEHTLLFNPLGPGGVTVVNQPGLELFRYFSRAVTVAHIRQAWPGDASDVINVLTRLRDVQVIEDPECASRPEFGPSQMLTAWLHVTNACNLRCPYCYLTKSPEGMDEATGRAAVDAVVSSAIAHGLPAVKLKYAGGEASLNHALVLKLHEYAKQVTASRGVALHATLLTNGVRLAPALLDALQAGDIGIMISLDGVGEQHDAQRPFASGKPSFELVDRTLANLRERGCAPHLSITITDRNAAGLADTVRFALDRDLTFSLNFFRDNDCAASFSDLRYEEERMISALLEAFGVIEERLPRWSVLGSILDRGQLLAPRQRSCGVGQDYVVIDQRGRVAKCHMEIERTLGDVFRSDPLQLVRSDTRTVLNLAVDEKEGCRDCFWRYWCSGGCAVATFRATGRYDVKSPNCHIYKAIYPEALRLEGLRLLKYAESTVA